MLTVNQEFAFNFIDILTPSINLRSAMMSLQLGRRRFRQSMENNCINILNVRCKISVLNDRHENETKIIRFWALESEARKAVFLERQPTSDAFQTKDCRACCLPNLLSESMGKVVDLSKKTAFCSSYKS